MDKYRNITFPFPGTVEELSKDDAKQYFDWFLQQIPSRIYQLSGYIIKSVNFLTWIPNNTPESLVPLGQWFSRKILTRDLTPNELQEINAKMGKLQGVVPIPETDLSHESFSLAIDIGMYLSQVLLNNVPSLHWELIVKPRNSLFYNHPVIKSTGKMICDPVHLSIVYAYGLINGTCQAERLKEIYEIWKYDFVENTY
jgi:hypothetical protein